MIPFPALWIIFIALIICWVFIFKPNGEDITYANQVTDKLPNMEGQSIDPDIESADDPDRERITVKSLLGDLLFLIIISFLVLSWMHSERDGSDNGLPDLEDF